MTRDEIMAMKPGRELDALVAEKVMGWVRGDGARGQMPWYDPGHAHKRHGGVFAPPPYSTDIGVAWKVVEKWFGKGLFATFELVCMKSYGNIHWNCWFGGNPTGKGETAPEAICKAALLAVCGEADHEG